MKPPPSVFVPPGAGQRRVAKAPPPAKPASQRAPGIEVGWTLLKIFAIIAMLGIGGVANLNGRADWKKKADVERVYGKAQFPERQPNPPKVSKGAAEAEGPLAFALGKAAGALGIVGYALFLLYCITWWVVPLIGIAHGDGVGAFVYFLVSPVVLVLSGVMGFLSGAGLAELFH